MPKERPCQSLSERKSTNITWHGGQIGRREREGLLRQRGATLWLEIRRLEDERRWSADTGAAHDSFLDNRDKCIPISQAEKLANPNFRG